MLPLVPIATIFILVTVAWRNQGEAMNRPLRCACKIQAQLGLHALNPFEDFFEYGLVHA